MVKNCNALTILFNVLLFLAIPSIVHAIDTSRPGPENVPTKVEIDLYVIDIDDINSAQQNFISNIFIEAKWKDQRLANRKGKTTYDIKDVWNPNLQFLNRQKLFKSFPDIVEVDSDGTVVYKQRVVGGFSQPLDLHDFPFDEQKFAFQLLSIDYTPSEVDLVENSTGISAKFSVADWDIIGFDVKKVEYKFVPDEPPTEGMILTINAKRYAHFYIYKFIVPLLLIVFMSWIVFWMDPTDYATKISIAITSMLTLIAYQLLAVSSLPEVPYLTRIDSLMLFSTILVFATLIEVTVTSILTKRDNVELARSIDTYCRYIFPLIFVFIFITRIIKIQ